jgi:hypothetical protein
MQGFVEITADDSNVDDRSFLCARHIVRLFDDLLLAGQVESEGFQHNTGERNSSRDGFARNWRSRLRVVLSFRGAGQPWVYTTVGSHPRL